MFAGRKKGRGVVIISFSASDYDHKKRFDEEYEGRLTKIDSMPFHYNGFFDKRKARKEIGMHARVKGASVVRVEDFEMLSKFDVTFYKE